MKNNINSPFAGLRPAAWFLLAALALPLYSCFGSNSSNEKTKNETTDSTQKNIDPWKILNVEYQLVQSDLERECSLSGPMGVHKRDLLTVMCNRQDMLLVAYANDYTLCKIEELKGHVKQFLSNPDNNATLSEQVSTDIPLLGPVPVSNGIISFKHDPESSQQFVNSIKRELITAILELRQESAQNKFGKDYWSLSDEQRDAINQWHPMMIFDNTNCIDVIDNTRAKKEPELSISNNRPKSITSEYSIVDKEEEPVKIYTVVEQDPEFPGGLEARNKFIADNIKYPQIARDNNITGKVFVTFVVEKDGRLTNIKLLRDIGGGCGKEAIRIVQNMPKWIPGKSRGKNVRVQVNMPVNFTLE